ncbi:hypothetical protein [Roseinatronobacter monicus]|uniref:hypothetical protein n=1 Tax=Roseinatronobacter monicus TaxID=393481 RepID=UPI001FE7CF37|nr:hypothetical protein [Roseinatronobacter monicus]
MSREEMEEAEEYVFRDREYIPATDEGVGADPMDAGGATDDGGGTMDGGGTGGLIPISIDQNS